MAASLSPIAVIRSIEIQLSAMEMQIGARTGIQHDEQRPRIDVVMLALSVETTGIARYSHAFQFAAEHMHDARVASLVIGKLV
jgi:hypothetical protein